MSSHNLQSCKGREFLWLVQVLVLRVQVLQVFRSWLEEHPLTYEKKRIMRLYEHFL